eukprot:2283272-Amphidinium_carterae.1
MVLLPDSGKKEPFVTTSSAEVDQVGFLSGPDLHVFTVRVCSRIAARCKRWALAKKGSSRN